MSRILVFGGAGYIGSHTCKRLAEAGHEPVTFDNLCEGHRDFVKWGPMIEADITDADAVRSAIAREHPEAIIHFAARSIVPDSLTDPGGYYRTNVTGSLNILEAARDCGGVPIVFSSSCAVYGAPARLPIREDTPKSPASPYGRSKLFVEEILTDFSAAHGLRSMALRYFNACGADPTGEIGERHRNETHLIPRAIFSALGRVADFRVFGDDYDTPDGSAIRDYIHVADLADAHVRACEYLLAGGQSDALNIGSGHGCSVFEIVRAVEAAGAGRVPLEIAPRRPGDPPELVADTTRAQDVLGFSPRHSDLETIIETALAWHRKDA